MKTPNANERKILAVDDDPEIADLIAEALSSQGYQVKVAYSGEQALQIFHEWRPHLVLLDLYMPNMGGFKVLEQMRSTQTEYTSVIFISGHAATEDVITGLDRGADDYICKPVELHELFARVRTQLRIKDLRDELEVANKRLSQLVDLDDLTGLYNMRSIYDKLSDEIARGKRYKHKVAVIMMDMDFFKSVNDESDHLFGSYVLSEVGRIISDNIRKSDFAARYGGDEFLIVLSQVEKEGAITFADNLLETIRSTEFKNHSYSTSRTCSIGVALLDPSVEEITSREFVRCADKALYDAKKAGRNQYQLLDLT